MSKRQPGTEIIAERIKARRKELGMTQQDLAYKADVGLRSVKAWEAHTRVPEAYYRDKLARALHVTREWLEGSADCSKIEQIRAEIELLSNANPSYWHSGDMVEREEVLDIINKYREEQTDAT